MRLGNILKHFRNLQKEPAAAEQECQIEDLDDEFDEINPSHSQLLPIPTVSASQIMDNIVEISHVRIVSTDSTVQMTATALLPVRDIFGVAADEGLLIVDSGPNGNSWVTRNATVRRSTSTQRAFEVGIDVESGRASSFKLVDGATRISSLVLMQTPHGWVSTNVIEPTGVSMLLSIKGLRALQAVYFSMSTAT